ISSSGVITFGTAPDYETKSSYAITVNVTDGANSASQAFTVTVTNVNEDDPVISGLAATIEVVENETAVVTVSASDPDGDALTYSLTGINRVSFNISSSGVITFVTAPDYETKSSYAITVNVSDGTTTTSQAVTVTVVFATQVLSSSPSSLSAGVGATGIEMTVNYDTNPTDYVTTGIGVEIFFDSTKVSFVSMTDLYGDDLIGITGIPSSITDDIRDDDSDEATDQKATIAYASLQGEFPDPESARPLPLFKMTFDAASETFEGETSINFVVEKAAGYGVNAPSVVVCFGCFSFDIDNDGNTAALTDGLLVLRYVFGFSGSTLTQGAIASGATRTESSAIETYLETNSVQLDIDGDGNVQALTDGLLLLRYLFGFEGDTLIGGAVSGSATRTTADEVKSYIESRITTDG
ncbi:cadherin repeat domain-containing protein, partial [Gammaproteobacteria bacterium]|nr:cadherin repeat domain-containing protein [Gammaproteobacteria bacterium]